MTASEATTMNYESEYERVSKELELSRMEKKMLTEELNTTKHKLAVLQGFAAAVEIIFDGQLYKVLEEYGE